MALTGRADGAPLRPPDGIVDRIAGLGSSLGVDGLALLGERAAVGGLRRQGDVSCGGATRLLATADGWLAVSLAREDDVALLAAWLGLDGPPPGDPWPVVAGAVASRRSDDVLEQGVLLGLPLAVVPDRPPAAPAVTSGPLAGLPVRAERVRSGGTARARPLVVDLSSLWAGPLCARLLGDGGARVVKVESTGRPDGARRGPAAFYELLHAGHESVALDLRTSRGVDRLRGLLAAADVVVTSSRPRALEQLGIDPAEVVRMGPAVWTSITGHGSLPGDRDRVAFGDDAAAGGGLVADDGGRPCFVADAVADPLTGVTAAAATHLALRAGGGWVIDVAMTGVAAHVAEGGAGECWRAGDPEAAVAPSAPRPSGPAPALGEHTDRVLIELGLR